MSSLNVVLTPKGFRILSYEFFTNLISILLLFSALSIVIFLNPKLISYFSIVYIFFTLVFMYFRLRVGYIYPISYYYQITLFVLLTPYIFINWVSLSVLFLSFSFLMYKKNPFRNIPFPIGLFASLFVISISLILYKVGWQKFSLFHSTLSFPLEKGMSNLSGIFFPLLQSDNLTFAENSYSYFENFGYYTILLSSIIFLRQNRFWSDISLIILFSICLVGNYSLNLQYAIQTIIITSGIWYIIFSAPGRKTSYITSILSMLLLAAIIGFIRFLNPLFYLPAIVILSLFFVIQTLLHLLIDDKFPRNRLIDISGVR